MNQLARLCLMVALPAISLLAQDISGTIGGTVVDPAKAAVPGAKVTITNLERNQVVRTPVTDSNGLYSAPLLPVGTYSIKVEAAGFKTTTRDNIALNVSDSLTINVALELGNLTESVTVEATPFAVELSSPANSSLMEAQQIRELSINSRNYVQLVSLMPGVSSDDRDQLFIGGSLPSGLANTMPFSINGARNSANSYTVDGADNVDRGGNLTLLNYPSIDAIEQFKVSRSLYTADAGRAGGAQVNVVTRGGSSKFHGSAYEFMRNDAFAANNWINNANSVNMVDGKAKIPPLRWNNFGFTLGGPVYIPGKYNTEKNKTFFFYSQEFRKIITYTTFTATIPTLNERQGIFTNPVCVAMSGTTCAQTDTQIKNINPVAASYIKDIFSKLPAPTSGNTLFNPARNIYDHRQELARVDHTFNQRFQVWGRLLWDTIPTTEPGGLFTGSPIPNGATTKTNSPGHSFTAHAVYAMKSNVLNDAGYSYSYGGIIATPAGLTSKENSPDINVSLPFANTTGVVPAVAFTGGSSVLGYGPYNNYSHNHAIFDNLTWIKGRHSLKFGISVNSYLKHENLLNSNNYGTLSFTTTGVPTGTTSFQQAWANFLQGNVGTFTQSSVDLTADVHSYQIEAYAQDDFRLARNLTLYYGVRWSFFGQPTDSYGRLSNFDPSAYKASDAPQINAANGQLISGTGNATNGIIYGGKGSPYGDAVSNNVYSNFAPRIGIGWDPTGRGKTSVRTGYGIYYDSPLFGIYEQNIGTNAPYVQSITISNSRIENPAGGTASVNLNPLALRGTPLPYRTPYSQQWSFDVQHQIAKALIADVGYFGSKGTRLLGIIDINEAYPGAAYAAGLKTGTGTIFTTTDTPKINLVRPYRGYNAINVVQPWFNSNYHSLQSSLQKNFRTGGLVKVAYTWSKNMTDSLSDRSNAPQNSYNFHESEYGPARLDRTHIFSFNYVYYLPFFKNMKGAAGYVLKGWQVSGNTQYGTGLPYTVSTSSVDPAGLGLLGSSAASARPDQICNANVDAPHQFGGAAQNLLWFKTSCFAPVPQGEIRPGNAGRNTIRGPGYGKWDVSLMKNFRIAEKFNLQFRGESFNVANHANPSSIGSTNNTSSLFGKITGFRDARIVQFGLKLSF